MAEALTVATGRPARRVAAAALPEPGAGGGLPRPNRGATRVAALALPEPEADRRAAVPAARRVSALAAAVALLAAGCGGSSAPDWDGANPGEGDGSGATSDREAPEGAVDGGEDAPRGDSGEPERLQDYLGGFGADADPEEVRAYHESRERRVQELVARCMAEEGFEYIPAVRPAPGLAFAAEDQIESARRHGFGVTTHFGAEDWGLSDAEEWTDPNQAIVEALTDSERTAYYDALYAPPAPAATETDSETGEVIAVHEGGFAQGCQGRAYEEAYDDDGLEEVYEQLDLESMWMRVEADPRVQGLNDEWSRCMGDRGYTYDGPDGMYASVYDEFLTRLEEIVGPDGGWVDPFEGLPDAEIEERASSLSPEELDDLFESAQREARQRIDQAALSALQDEERALAVAAAECSVAMSEGMDEIWREYEAELIEENRALLEEYRAGRGG